MFHSKFPSTKIFSIWIFVLLLFLAGSINQTFATDYYFSSQSGNDNRSSTEAQNPSTPWKSIDKLNAFASNLNGSDRILFKSGETFYGTIHIIKSGAVGAPIQYTSYGSGAKPIITSLVTINNWTSVGNGKYQADLSAYNLSKVQVVLLNDKIQEIGRYPNSDAPNGGYLTIAASGNNYISTQGSNPYSGAGGEVVIRKNNWVIDRHQISSVGGNYISYLNGATYPAQAGYGYFLQNHSSLLDKAGEWAYDPASKKLTVNLTGYSLSTAKVAVATKDHLFTNQMFTTNMTFSNLHLKGSNANLFNISKSENVKIENCLFEYAGENAINSSDIKGLIIQNNEINNSLNNGIYIAYGSPNSIIRNNLLTNIMKFQGMGKNSDMNGIGIFLGSDGNNSIIEKNTLDKIGFNGIHFGGNYTKVLNNYINEYCFHKQDGGGIYTNSDGFRDRNNVGREIIGNIILNGKGSKLGTIEGVELVEGIYLDDNSAGIKVADNTIAFVNGKGLYLHNANNIEIINNLFYKTKSQVHFAHDNMGDPIRNIKISNNKFSSIEDSDYAYSISSKLDDVGYVGTINSNYFLDPYNNDFFIYTKTAGDGVLGVNRNLQNWSSTFGFDTNSTKPELNLSRFDILSSTLIKSSDFNNASIIAGAYNAATGIDANGISGNSYLVSPNNSNQATVYIHVGAVENGDHILVEFDMKSSLAEKPIELFLEGTYNIDKGEGNKIAATKTSATTYQVLLSSLISKTNESLVFRIPNTAKNVYLDNIKISKVEIDAIDKSEQIYFGYNYSNSSVQKPLDGTYKNAKNESFSGSVTIPAYSSVLLAKISAETPTVTNKAPAVSLTKPTENQVLIQGSNPVQLVANPTDPEGAIKRVEFYANDKLLTTLTNAPYSYTWNEVAVGNHKVHAKVIDNGDLSAVSGAINFTVNAPELANVNFTGEMVSPANNSTYTVGESTVILNTNASNAGIKVKQIEYLNWGYPLVKVTTAPFDFAWTKIEAGTYKVSAIITDIDGKTYTTDNIQFSVAKQTASLLPTSVSIAQPSNNQVFVQGIDLVNIKAQVSDPSKVKSIAYYNWGYLLTTTSALPHEFKWNSIEVGDYSVYAVVTDIQGNTTTSKTVNFKVTSPSNVVLSSTEPTTVAMVQPYDNQVFQLGNNGVLLKATTDGDVSNVRFFNWFLPLVSVSNKDLEFNWSKIEAGNYMVYAEITDSKGKVILSEPISFSVKNTAARIGAQNELLSASDSTKIVYGTQILSGSDSTKMAISKELQQKQEEITQSTFGIKMGPNPTSSHLRIFFEDYPLDLETKISIVDMRGIEMMTTEANTNDGTVEMDVNALRQGVYIVKLNLENKYVQTKKLIIN
ncbi:Ig-like domain-containing protein [Algoriphagus antarcticus]|uniref:Parallel beta-helix repeat protein n=1 Tax=Algoriphagus antarcticus TaxID=238540 RepID=A0A3E0E5U0_9BACT|nr:Ig-like domain-containing protein [Algoriphagus antarcticus]REG92649.1 parallel beta-helix repeat protein [Algoriphagus antarcticus]